MFITKGSKKLVDLGSTCWNVTMIRPSLKSVCATSEDTVNQMAYTPQTVVLQVAEARILKSCLLSGEVPLPGSHCWPLAIFHTVSFWPKCLPKHHFLMLSCPVKAQLRSLENISHSPLNSISNLWNIHNPNSTQDCNDAPRYTKPDSWKKPLFLSHFLFHNNRAASKDFLGWQCMGFK